VTRNATTCGAPARSSTTRYCRAVWQADIVLCDVRIPVENRLPGASSFKDTGRILVGTRSQCAFSALGHAVAAYDAALTNASQSTQFGKRLVEFQLVQARLVHMLQEVAGMQLFCMRLVQLHERGELDDTVASLAKLNNTSKARQICLEARDLLGGKASCSTTTSCGTWPTSRPSTPTRAPRRSRPSWSAGTSPASVPSPERHLHLPVPAHH